MTNKILLIDGNSVMHAHHNATKLTVGDLQVQAVFGFIKGLRGMLERTSATPIVVWDGSSNWRKEIYPDYKGNRKPLDAKQAAHKEAFKRQGPILELALQRLGVMQVRSPFHEADDIAAHMVRNTLRGRRITLISGDRDWLQLVDTTIDWYDPINDRRVTLEDFLEKTGYTDPGAFVEGKALQGDSSDNIPGVGGIGEKGAMELLARFNSLAQLRAQHGRDPTIKLSKAVRELLEDPEKWARFERNLALMDMNKARPLKPGEAQIKRGHPDPEGFKKLCEQLAFASILRQLPTFLRPYGIEYSETAAAGL